MNKSELTFTVLRTLLDYEPETGAFNWRVSRGTARAGDVAGNVRADGYIAIKIFGRLYSAHRLAWLWMTGAWPPFEIDHRDTDGTNNRWSNLRPATHLQNMRNKKKPRHNTSGLKGVSYCRKRRFFTAQIQIEGRQVHLGTFKTAELAHEAYRSASERLHGEFARAA